MARNRVNASLPPVLLGLALLAGLLSGCELSAGSVEEIAPSPEALFTAAAQTAEAMRLQRFGLTPSPPAAEALIATAAAVTPTATLPAPPATQPGAAATDAPAPGSAAAGDQADYVADVTIPDGTTFAPGETFEKTWRIANTGKTTWTTTYELVYIDGSPLGAPASIPLSKEVAPGEQVEISVTMTAPEQAGSYTSYWKMRNAQGQLFGFGSAGKEAVWVKINVSGGESAAATAVPTSGQVVTAVDLSVDNAAYTGACPHTFLINGQLSLSRPASVTYLLEAGDVSGAEVRLPQPAQRNLDAGVHTLAFEVTLGADVSGWLRLHVITPESVYSEAAPFSLTCSG
ncbi:MAG: NBR1-Ig-like domain-containing protein [Chloroflexota bacterium]